MAGRHQWDGTALGFLAMTCLTTASKNASKGCEVAVIDEPVLKSTSTRTKSSTVPVVHEGARRPDSDCRRFRKRSDHVAPCFGEKLSSATLKTMM